MENENGHSANGNAFIVANQYKLKPSVESSVFKSRPHKSDGLSKNARRLLKRSSNLVRHYVEQILIRRYSIANALADSKAEVD